MTSRLQRALEHVAAVEQQSLAAGNAFAARALDRGCDVSRASPRHTVGVGTRLERPVKIVGADYSEESRSGWECRSRARHRRGERFTSDKGLSVARLQFGHGVTAVET